MSEEGGQMMLGIAMTTAIFVPFAFGNVVAAHSKRGYRMDRYDLAALATVIAGMAVVTFGLCALGIWIEFSR
jgi:uncharacterized membrane protein